MTSWTAATETIDQQPPRRREDWIFGPSNPFTDEESAWWKRHEPTLDRWLSSLDTGEDSWWQVAEHAAQCLVSRFDQPYTWEGFSVGTFLFEDLWDGGTVGLLCSPEDFFDYLVEALQRFVSDTVVDPSIGERLLAEMRDARDDFVRCYDEATPAQESVAIAERYRSMAESGSFQ